MEGFVIIPANGLQGLSICSGCTVAVFELGGNESSHYTHELIHIRIWVFSDPYSGIFYMVIVCHSGQNI